MQDMEIKSIVSKIPAGRLGEPAEVADAVLFLVRNQYANNCLLTLDGGLGSSVRQSYNLAAKF